jgi:periplasmic divalent cation tolerance protein
MELLAVCTTVGSREAALKLAHAAVEARLAACVQIAPIESVYVWQGAVQQEGEFRLMFKTTTTRYDALARMIVDRHPYELPAVYALPVAECTEDYRAWVIENTRQGATPSDAPGAAPGT